MMKLNACLLLWCFAAATADGQTFRIPANLTDSATLARTMPSLAEQVMAAEARAKTPTPRALAAPFEMWASAKAASASGESFSSAFTRSFRQTFARLDDTTAMLAIRALSVGRSGVAGALRAAVQRVNGRTEVTRDEALALVRAWRRASTYADVAPLVTRLIDEDDARRYIVDRDIRVPVSGGATVCALIVRPRQVSLQRRPALLTFTIYVDSAATLAEARRAAANGYAGVVGFTRGKACSEQTPVPYVYDGVDAAALIDWIAAQKWSDGRVGMYGGSYSGFTAWAAAKRMPKALKAIMVGAPVGPGIDVPMEGNIVWNFIYPWPFYTTNNKTLDNATYFDNARWLKLNREWYTSGRAYRDLEKIDGTPNPVFAAWIAHSSYDEYWRGMIPYGKEFANVGIPVLQTAGYFFGGPGAAVHYLTQHYAQDPVARHYLLIGPYDHPQGQRGVVDAFGDTVKVIAGYETDPVARIDIVADLRYQWFDWILRGGSRPKLLADRINYQVMGANIWRHEPSLAAMSNGRLRLYLAPRRASNGYKLSRDRILPDSFTTLRVNLAYRGDIDSTFPGGAVRDSAINTYEALAYVSDPIDESVEVSGLYSGHLEIATNKRDFDLSVQLFELTARGEYMQLPPVQMRASYARDLSVRRLLTPGARETLDFKSIRLVSRRLQRGSRIVAVIGPNKQPAQQINYGSGKDVNDETIADAGEPLEIRWFGSSYIDVPVRR